MPPSSCQTILSTHISRKNFGSLLDRIRHLIHDADFVALDTRLTGAHSASWRKSHVLDTCEISYHKLKHSVENFAVWQFGICPFKWMEADKKYVAQPCNFYLFPRGELNFKLDDDNFLCQTEFLELLARHGFDFNTCIQYGLSHISREQESIAAMQMELQSEDSAAMCMVGKLSHGRTRNLWMSSADQLFAKEIRVKLMDWIENLKINSSIPHIKCDAVENVNQGNGSNKHGFHMEASGSNQDHRRSDQLITSSVIWYKSYESLQLGHASLKWKSLAHGELQVLLEVLCLDYKDLVVVVQPEASSSSLKSVQVFYTTSDEEKIHLLEELEQRQTGEKARKLAEAIGFRHIIDALVDARKVVVGHHCILGFAHIYKSFFKPLPFTTAKFTAGLLENFPCIFDTKCIMKNIPQLETDASTLLPTIYLKLFGNHNGGSCKVKVEISDNLSVVENSTQQRNSLRRSTQQEEVGYYGAGCAYMAGCLFAYICDVLNTDPSDLLSLTKPVKSGSSTELHRFKNLICMNDATTSVLDLSMGCEVADKFCEKKAGDVSNVALVWGYPHGSSSASIQSFIKDSIGFNCPISVFPVDGSSALVVFEGSEVQDKFLISIQRMPKKSFAGGIRAASFGVYEFLCRSSLSMTQLADCANHLQGCHE